jgi:hypothetical protein
MTPRKVELNTTVHPTLTIVTPEVKGVRERTLLLTLALGAFGNLTCWKA